MRKEKRIFELLNEAAKQEQLETEQMDVFEKERILKTVTGIKQDRKRKIQLKWAFAIVALFFIGSLNPIRSTVQAAVQSFLDTFQLTLKDIFEVEDAPANATISIGQTANFGEVTMKLEDMAFIDDTLYTVYLVDLPDDEDFPFPKGFDDEDLLYLSGFDEQTLTINDSIVERVSTDIGHIIDEERNIYSSLQMITLSDVSIKNSKLSFEFYFNKMFYIIVEKPNYYVRKKSQNEPPEPLFFDGEASFTVNTTLRELTANTKIYDIRKTILVESENYTIHQMVTHPILSYIQLSLPEYQLIEFIGVNEEGKKVVFEGGSTIVSGESAEQRVQFNAEESEITNQELLESEWIEVQFYSAGLPEGEATFVPYGEPFRIDLKNPED